MTLTIKNQRTSGFTIVELLVIVVVIGILAAISIVSYTAVTESAKLKTVETDAQGIAVYLNKYKSENGGYPTSLEDVSGAPKVQSEYEYSYDAVNGTYCVTASVKGASAYVKSGSSQAKEGGCPGHGINGEEAVTNYALNPSFETGTGNIALYNGATVSRQTVSYASSGSHVGRITKGNAGASLIFMVYPITWSANSPVSVRFKARLAPGTSSSYSINPSIQAYQSGSGVGSATGCTIQNPTPLSTTEWSDIIIQGCTTPNATMNSIGIMVIPNQSWTATSAIEIDSIMIVNKSTIGSFADGNSDSWLWNGTPNSSTSIGPAR